MEVMIWGKIFDTSNLSVKSDVLASASTHIMGNYELL